MLSVFKLSAATISSVHSAFFGGATKIKRNFWSFTTSLIAITHLFDWHPEIGPAVLICKWLTSPEISWKWKIRRTVLKYIIYRYSESSTGVTAFFLSGRPSCKIRQQCIATQNKGRELCVHFLKLGTQKTWVPRAKSENCYVDFSCVLPSLADGGGKQA